MRNARPVQNLNCSRVVNLNQYNPVQSHALEQEECEATEQCDADEDLFESG